MKLSDLHPVYQEKLDFLRGKIKTPSLWQRDAAELLMNIDKREFTANEMLGYLHTLKRVEQTLRAGLENNQDYRDEYENIGLLHWDDFIAPPADDELQDSLAAKLYNIDNPDDVAFVSVGDGAKKMGPWIINKCLEDNIKMIVDIMDESFGNLVMKHADEDGVKALAKQHVEDDLHITKAISARPGSNRGPDIEPDIKNKQLYSRESRNAGNRRLKGEVHFTLTVVPTPKDAEIDGMDYGDYTKLFFEMCDQPWDKEAHPKINIDAAHRELIKQFNAASKVRFTNNDGTDIEMELVDEHGKNMTFANSLIFRNVPGSEIFSAPRIDSVNGTIVAKGKFITRYKDVVEDLTMVFKDGVLVDYDARTGKENFEKMITMDETPDNKDNSKVGSKRIGELGIGTNPHLKRHVANGLLVEKIGGSFHLALGDAYTMDEYMGDPVHVDNGNRSAVHWDITTMLYGKEGKIYLDDKPVMDDGVWLDPKYDVLNRGWAAIPKEERPDYWKDYESEIPAPKP